MGRDESNRYGSHPVGRRRAAGGGGVLHGHGVLHRGSAGGPPRGVAHLSNCAKSQDALVRTSPERRKRGVAQVLFGAWILRAAVRGSAGQHGLPRVGVARNIELPPVLRQEMIEVLTMSRQHSSQKKFPFADRNFRDSGMRTAAARSSSGLLSSAFSMMVVRLISSRSSRRCPSMSCSAGWAICLHGRAAAHEACGLPIGEPRRRSADPRWLRGPRGRGPGRDAVPGCRRSTCLMRCPAVPPKLLQSAAG
jgi:hypothetical protein